MNPTEVPNPFRAEIEAIRARAHETPVLLALTEALPEFTEGQHHAPGLYLDRKPVAGIRLGKEYRVSVARVMSVTEAGALMVGQCQITAHIVNGNKRWKVRWYVHAPQLFYTASFEDEQKWWLQVLERHLARGGEPPASMAYAQA